MDPDGNVYVEEGDPSSTRPVRQVAVHEGPCSSTARPSAAGLEAAARALAAMARMPERDAVARLEARLGSLRRALLASPYYRERLAAAGLSPRDLRRLADLPCFPALERSALAEHWRELALLGPGLTVARSSGSTGEPVRLVQDAGDRVHMWAVLRFWLRVLSLRLPPRPRVALLCALPGTREHTAPLPLLDDGRFLRVSVLRPGAAARLARAAPHVIFSDPEGLHWLAAQRRAPAPRLVLTSALHFAASARATLGAAVPAPVVNYYSTTETGPIAWECLATPETFHVLAPDVWVESVGGELVVTRLRRGATPILRYRTGDRGQVDRDECACDFRGWSIRGFRGRGACWFVRPDGQPLDAWRLAPELRRHPLRAFCLAQRGPASFELRIAAASVPPRLRARLRAALRRLGWPDARLDVRLAPVDPAAGAAKPVPFRYSAW